MNLPKIRRGKSPNDGKPQWDGDKGDVGSKSGSLRKFEKKNRSFLGDALCFSQFGRKINQFSLFCLYSYCGVVHVRNRILFFISFFEGWSGKKNIIYIITNATFVFFSISSQFARTYSIFARERDTCSLGAVWRTRRGAMRKVRRDGKILKFFAPPPPRPFAGHAYTPGTLGSLRRHFACDEFHVNDPITG